EGTSTRPKGSPMLPINESKKRERVLGNRIKIPILDQSTTEFYKEEEENIDDEETMYDEEDYEVTKELYEDVNLNLGNEDTEMTNADQGATDQQNVSQQSGFEQLLNLENPSPADNEIASLLETSARHVTAVLENTSDFTTTTPPPSVLQSSQQNKATPTPTPTTSEATTSFPSLPDFTFVLKFNERVFNLEKDMLEIKQVDQYAQALSFIPAIVDRYMDNKLGEAINKVILAHNLDCKQEAQDEKNSYIELVDTSMKALIKEEFNTQLPHILPQAVSDFANLVIEKNVSESVEAAVLTRSSSQPTSTYEAVASLSEFELTKILIDKMEKNKSYDKADYKKKLYDALVESYNTRKDVFDSYGKVFSLKSSRDEDKYRDPSAGSDRGKKRRKSSKEAESSKDSRSKENKSSSTSKDASKSQHKSSGKSAHAEEPSHTVEDSSMQQDQEFVTGDNDEQPANKEVTKAGWFKKPERLPTLDPDWSKRQQGGDLSRRYSTSVTKSKAATYDLKWIEDLVCNLWSPVQMYDYGHLEEIEVRRDDQKLYTFKEGDFKRLRLQDIEDMLLLLVQEKLTNLTIDEQYDLNVALLPLSRLNAGPTRIS
ncbi:hypothetical protein Tco_0973938, partial [Tanacetum coccineum]